MTVNNSSKPEMPVNHNIQLSAVPAEKINHYQSMGYQFIMLKVPDASELDILTPQEREVLRLFMRGMIIKRIAEALGIDERNVRKVLAKIRKKYACQNNATLVITLKNRGLDIFLV